MTDNKVAHVKKPVLVGELAVYFISPGVAQVIETDCRVELITTPDRCTCCTFRFSSYRNPGFQCKHIKAVRQVLELQPE